MNAQDRAYQYIKDAITAYKLTPNQRVPAAAIAEQLGVSRTPVREALGRLEQERLVHRDAGWGYVVREMTFSDIVNIFRVREALEIEALREALPLLTPGILNLMSSLLETAEKALEDGDIAEFLLANRRFHDTIAEHSGNWVLQDMLRIITCKIRILGAAIIEQYPNRACEILEENKIILKALMTETYKEAEESLRHHILRARECVTILYGQKSGTDLADLALGPEKQQSSYGMLNLNHSRRG